MKHMDAGADGAHTELMDFERALDNGNQTSQLLSLLRDSTSAKVQELGTALLRTRVDIGSAIKLANGDAAVILEADIQAYFDTLNHA